MSNRTYNKSANPIYKSSGSSSLIRTEFTNIDAGVAGIEAELDALDVKFTNAVFSTVLPTQTGKANHPLITDGTDPLWSNVVLTNPATAATLTLADNSSLITSGAYSVTLTATAETGITLPITGTLATLAGTEAFLNKTVNKVTLTAPATAATLTLIDGTTVTGPPETSAIGYMNIPQQSKTDSYTCVLGDAGKHIYLASGASKTLTIPANASVAYPIGTAITFVNLSTACTIAITSNTLYLAGLGTTGSRTLAQYGMATALKLTATTWMISGSGLT